MGQENPVVRTVRWLTRPIVITHWFEVLFIRVALGILFIELAIQGLAWLVTRG